MPWFSVWQRAICSELSTFGKVKQSTTVIYVHLLGRPVDIQISCRQVNKIRRLLTPGTGEREFGLEPVSVPLPQAGSA